MKSSSVAYRNYALAILAVILAFNTMDRLALGLLLQSIKLDLRLSDTQLGFLTGIAFALFYSAMGIPIARWADRGNRVTIIWLTTAMWSVFVALCGLAGSYRQLLAIRVGVAIGEAGCVPPAHSLIADYFDRAERPRAVARYMLGGSLATVVGYFAGGLLNETYGWRDTFLILGLPGLALALLVRITLREPRLEEKIAAERRDHPRIAAVCRTLWQSRTFRHLLICFSLLSFFGFGIGNWQPAFFVRSFGLSTRELGTWMALIWGIGGSLGTYCGGVLAARYAANDERLQLLATVCLYLTFGLISALGYLSHHLYLSFAMLGTAAIGANMAAGPMLAMIQTLVAPRMRAMAIALVYLSANLFGMGLGPLAVGALSDSLRSWGGEESLRYALLAMCPGYWWAAWHLWRASRSVTRDVESVQVHAKY